MGMNLFGVGPWEFLLFLLLALLILGPERMISASRSVARFIRNLIISPTWRTVNQVQNEIRTIPEQLLREAGLEDAENLVPSPDEIMQEAGLDELSRQVTEVQQQVRGEWNEMTVHPDQPPTSSSKPAPASPPGSGIPTVALPSDTSETSSSKLPSTSDTVAKTD